MTAPYFCHFDDIPGLLVLAPSETDARVLATAATEGTAPSRLTALGPGFVFEVIDAPEDADESYLLSPVASTDDRLWVLEEGLCGDSNEHHGEVVLCERAFEHAEAAHEATTASGDVVQW